MIIKEVQIKNFRSYYGDNNKFEFSQGLTLILGDNGDGKTTFFEALHWLFDTTDEKGNIDHLSEMRKSKMEIGDTATVSVSMLFEHDGDKSVEKSFVVERAETHYRTSSIIYKGYETSGPERIQVSGKSLINRCYDAFIQRFSMFKGESELNVFDNPTALKELVDKFSDIKKFDTLVEYTASFEDKSNVAFLKEMKSDSKVSREANALEVDIRRLDMILSSIRIDIKEKTKSLEYYRKQLKNLEQSQESSEKYKDIQDRLNKQEKDYIRLNSQIHAVDYDHALLDDLWILCAYPTVLQEFKQKCSDLSKKRRELETDFNKQKSIEIGKLEAVKEIQGALANGAPELPWYLPNQETMEEMLHDHICKVCNRPAEEGSDAYNFMLKKLEEYKKRIALETEKRGKKEAFEEQELFAFNNIESLHHMSISLSGNNESQIAAIVSDITDRLELVERLKQNMKEVELKIQETKDEKSRLLIQAGNVSEDMMEKKFSDIKGLFQQESAASQRLNELDAELKSTQKERDDLQEKLDALNPGNSMANVYKEVHRILEEIAKAFFVAKKDNLRRFLFDLEEKANEYLDKLSASDFHGEVRLRQTTDDSTSIRLYSSNGTEIKKPSGSQLTVMYISVLFAISDFTQEKRDEDYPLIFDAATSSFGDSKEENFYNVIDHLKKQCIIVTKDFITKGQVRFPEIEKLTCSVYRIKKADGYDARNMATVRTTIEKLR